MGGSDPSQDPNIQMRETLRELREALHNQRESVVLLVMRRNQLQDEVTRLEKLLGELASKAELADKLQNAKAATDLREERKSREQELERMRTLLARAEAESEAAKMRLPDEQARLLQQLNDLKAQFVRAAGDRIEAGSPGGLGSDADEMWNRATEKTRNLEREASARQEVSAASSGQISAPTAAPASPPRSYEQSAEEMLAALEVRLGISPEPPAQAQDTSATTSAGLYLELDGAPPAPPSSSGTVDSPRTSTPETAPPGSLENVVSGETAASAVPSQTAADTDRKASTAEATASTAPSKAAPKGSPATVADQSKIETATVSKGERTRMEPTQRVRVAGIGTGGIFRGAHLPAYPEIPQVQLVALCDPDKEAQDLAYKRYQSLVEAKIKQARERDDMAMVERLENDLETVQICDDISEVIETIKPDLVDICTQPFLHVPLSIQALEAGIHVMCEKPISRSWLETERLLAAVERTGKFYQHNENWLWDRDYYTAKKLVDAGAIGEPILMFLATAHGGPEGNPKFWNPDFGGGGALLDNGIHAIGASWYISGLEKRPTSVKAAEPFGMRIRMPHRIIDGRFQQVTVDDDAHILIRFENPQNGAWSTAHVEGSWSHRDSPDTAIIGTTGKIVFVSEESGRYAVITDAYDRELRRIETSGPTWQHWPSSFYGEILNMVECVRNNVPSISTAQFGADCSAIVGASYLSEKNGRKAVSPDEFKAFARDIAGRYPNDPTGADNALIDALLAAVRK